MSNSDININAFGEALNNKMDRNAKNAAPPFMSLM